MKNLTFFIVFILTIGEMNAQTIETGTYSGNKFKTMFTYQDGKMEFYITKGLQSGSENVYNIIYSINRGAKNQWFMYADGTYNPKDNFLRCADKIVLKSKIIVKYYNQRLNVAPTKNDFNLEFKLIKNQKYFVAYIPNLGKIFLKFQTNQIKPEIMQQIEAIREGKKTQESIWADNAKGKALKHKTPKTNEKMPECNKPKSGKADYLDFSLSIYKEIRVSPAWKYKRKVYEPSNNILGSGNTYKVDKLMGIKFCQKWLDELNERQDIKNTYGELIFYRNTTDDPKSVILIEKSNLSYFDELNKQLSPSKLTNPSFLNPTSPIQDLEYSLIKNPSFTQKIDNSKTLEKYLKINYDYGLIPYNAEISRGINGSCNIQFYSNKSDQPLAFFQGKFINGVPNGYCLLTYYNPTGHYYSREQSNDTLAVKFIIIAGLWKYGIFQDECETQASQYSYVKSNLQKLFQMNVDTTKIKINILELIYNDDWFFPDHLTNDFHSVFEVRWPYNKNEYPTKDGWDSTSSMIEKYYDTTQLRNHYAYFETKGIDFYDRNLKFKLVLTEPELYKRYQAANPNPQKKDFVESYMFSKSKEYYYDDYTYVRISAEYPCHNYYCEKTFQREVNGIWKSETEGEWKSNYCTDIEINRRTKRSDPLVVVKSVKVGDYNEDCDGTFLGDLFRKSNLHFIKNSDLAEYAGSSINQVVKDLIKTVEYDYPIQQPDNSITKEENLLHDKTSAVVDRFRNSALYHFDNKDTLKGAWLVHTNKLVNVSLPTPRDYLILVNINQNGGCFILDLADLNPEKNYSNAINRLNLRIVNSRLIKISETTISIIKVEKDQLTFDNNMVWKRL